MKVIHVQGLGAVSPAGWGLPGMREALDGGVPLPVAVLDQAGGCRPLRVRPVPAPASRPVVFAHPRLRRASPISLYSVAAAIEALGEGGSGLGSPGRLGIVLGSMCGCSRYTRRLYDEVLEDPAGASPLVFPETVFNAPASHLAAVLGVDTLAYTLLGDAGVFLQALAVAADWLLSDRVDGCLVVAAEELDWPVVEAGRLFSRRTVLSEGAAALYLRCDQPTGALARLGAVTSSHLFRRGRSRLNAARRMRAELPAGGPDHWLCDGIQDAPRLDALEQAVWEGWPGRRLSPKVPLGEGLAAAAGWQCVAAVDALRRHGGAGALVSVVGANEQAIGAHFEAGSPPRPGPQAPS